MGATALNHYLAPPPRYLYMVKTCPKCGTLDPDDGALFCHSCGTRLPPRSMEKTGIVCSRCGTKNADMQAVFCNKCGSPLQIVPTAPARDPDARPAAAPPARQRSRCPSCGATLKEENRFYCDACGVYLRGDTRPAAPVENTPPSPPVPGSPSPGAGLPADGTGSPLPAKSSIPLLKWGLVAGAAVMVLVIIAAALAGMLPGTSPAENATPALHTGSPTPAPATQKTTAAKTPAPVPVKTTTTPIPAAVVPTKTAVTVTATVSATRAANVSANETVNASVTVIQTLPVTNASQLLSVGQTAFDGKGNLTVTGVLFKDKMSDPTPSYAIGKQYLIVSVTYQNLQANETIDADLSTMKVTDGGGYTYDLVSDVLLETPFLGSAIPPRERRSGNLLFIIPPQATLLKLHYTTATQAGATFQLT